MRAAAGATYATLRDGCCFSARNERLRNFCPVKGNGWLSRDTEASKLEPKGGVMKKVLLTVIEPTTATLLIALGIGLGITVHPVFFLAALLIAIAALIQSFVNAASQLTHRHP
jgi:hypothetical protein